MSAEKTEVLLKAFRQAVRQLESALNQRKNEFIRDSAIQRFEFTFELCWKALKAFLGKEGLEIRSPREAIQGAFQLGWIAEDPQWLEMIELRNLTSHTYDRRIAEKIYRRLPVILKKFESLAGTLRKLGKTK